jgi:hypothetical protein
MPELDEPALLRRLQSDWPASSERLIFVTGDTLAPGARSALDNLGRPVIEKPVSPEHSPRNPRHSHEAMNAPPSPIATEVDPVCETAGAAS